MRAADCRNRSGCSRCVFRRSRLRICNGGRTATVSTYPLGVDGVVRGAWRYEHIWKMTSTYAALLSAFTGTVVGVGFLLATYRRQRRYFAGPAG